MGKLLTGHLTSYFTISTYFCRTIYTALADPRERHGRAVPLGPISFNFMQFAEKYLPINGFVPPPFGVGTPSPTSGQSQIPSLYFLQFKGLTLIACQQTCTGN